ncbi:MAG: arginine deiminase-related protein [Pseudomonadota bacterium]
MTSNPESQLASTVVMVRPVAFQSNPLAAASNTFMNPQDVPADEEQSRAVTEFDGVVAALREAGVNVIVVDDLLEPHTPDAIFPNNWMTTHMSGCVVLYPMQVPNRRGERRSDIIDDLASKHGFRVADVIDLSPHEARGEYLEGTGSLVLDRIHQIAYACLSPRTHIDVLGEFAQRLDYEVVAFDAVDPDGEPIYHTNVMMNVGDVFAVICDESIRRQDQRAAVLRSLEQTGHEIIRITYEQMLSMAGNMLEIQSVDGEPLMAMSQRAHNALTAAQIRSIEAHARIVSAPIDHIEDSAGGSVRCMLAEIHLPMRDAQ